MKFCKNVPTKILSDPTKNLMQQRKFGVKCNVDGTTFADR